MLVEEDKCGLEIQLGGTTVIAGMRKNVVIGSEDGPDAAAVYVSRHSPSERAPVGMPLSFNFLNL